MNTLGIAVVGFGGMGHEHVRKLFTVKEFSVLGVFDLRQERLQLALSLGLTTYDSFAALLADSSVDVVLVATPNDSHKELSISAMKAGKHVICEKPVALSSAELGGILDVAQTTGRVFMVHQNRRWDEDYLVVRRVLEEGRLGRLFHLESRVLGSRGIPGDWRKLEKHGGGMMLDWGVHLLDRLLFLIPEKVARVFCQMNYPTGQEVDEGFHLFLTFETGQTALIEVGTRHFRPLPLWVVQGTEGTAVIQNWDLEGEIVVRGEQEGDARPIVAGAGLTKTMAPRTDEGEIHLPLPRIESDVREFYHNFAAVVRGEAAPLVPNEEVARVFRLMEAAFASHRSGMVVEFELCPQGSRGISPGDRARL